jgi:hypothetical protein
MNQPVPKVCDADVERVVKRDFLPEEGFAVLSALEEYGKKDWHREVPRVRLAILKLASGSREKLREAIAGADRDYRDVLSCAEYPSYSSRISPTEKDEAKHKHMIDADWQEYRAWREKK